MFDLFLGLRQAVEGGVQHEAEIVGSRPPFRDFLVLGLCNGYGNVGPLLGIFGFWAYVTGMGMSAHGFTHV